MWNREKKNKVYMCQRVNDISGWVSLNLILGTRPCILIRPPSFSSRPPADCKNMTPSAEYYYSMLSSFDSGSVAPFKGLPTCKHASISDRHAYLSFPLGRHLSWIMFWVFLSFPFLSFTPFRVAPASPALDTH